MMQKIVDETGVSLKLLMAAAGMIILFGSSWVQLNVKIADLSSELKYMNAQLMTLIAQSEVRLQYQIEQVEQRSSRELFSFQVEMEKALSEAGVKVALGE